MRKLSVFLLSLSALFVGGVHAEQPFGWIGSGHSSAYSLKPGEFEISGRAMRVNDTLDFLDLRADLLATTARLTDNSGDFKGAGAELRIGIWQGLELFYQQNSQDLTLKVDMPAQYEVDDLDQALRTQVQTTGFKWVLRETVLRDRAQPWSSLALEGSYTKSKSDEFGGCRRWRRGVQMRGSPSSLVPPWFLPGSSLVPPWFLPGSSLVPPWFHPAKLTVQILPHVCLLQSKSVTDINIKLRALAQSIKRLNQIFTLAQAHLQQMPVDRAPGVTNFSQ